MVEPTNQNEENEVKMRTNQVRSKRISELLICEKLIKEENTTSSLKKDNNNLHYQLNLIKQLNF